MNKTLVKQAMITLQEMAVFNRFVFRPLCLVESDIRQTPLQCGCALCLPHSHSATPRQLFFDTKRENIRCSIYPFTFDHLNTRLVRFSDGYCSRLIFLNQAKKILTLPHGDECLQDNNYFIISYLIYPKVPSTEICWLVQMMMT